MSFAALRSTTHQMVRAYAHAGLLTEAGLVVVMPIQASPWRAAVRET